MGIIVLTIIIIMIIEFMRKIIYHIIRVGGYKGKLTLLGKHYEDETELMKTFE
jgi:hypothetical protein